MSLQENIIYATSRSLFPSKPPAFCKFRLRTSVFPSLPQDLLLALRFCLACSVVSDSLQPRGPQQAGLPCPSPTPGACSARAFRHHFFAGIFLRLSSASQCHQSTPCCQNPKREKVTERDRETAAQRERIRERGEGVSQDGTRLTPKS